MKKQAPTFTYLCSSPLRAAGASSSSDGAAVWRFAASALMLFACSPTDTTSTTGAGRLEAPASNQARPVSVDNNDVIIATDNEQGTSNGSAVAASGDTPSNLGTETLCDGKDENNNGIIDDVDVGNDGLCDCIRLGFFGEIASDAGSDTGRFEDWLMQRSGQIPFKHLAATATLTAEWLSDLQVVIVGGMRDRASKMPAFSSEEIAALDDWIQNRGGGLFTLSGYTDDSRDAEPTVELLQDTGLGYDLDSVPPEGVIGDGQAPPVWLDGIVAPDHPTVAGVPEIGVYYGYPVTGDGTVVLQGEGYDLAMAKQVGAGRVFVFADEWITQDQTWSGLSQGQNDPCQQPCNEQQNICPIAEEQCANCEMQPCSDPNDTDPETCAKGCQPSCESETNRCNMYTADCASCTAETQALAEATPRFWLNTILWLTPDNECKIRVPLDLKIK